MAERGSGLAGRAMNRLGRDRRGGVDRENAPCLVVLVDEQEPVTAQNR
jgi:hypothetical protein